MLFLLPFFILLLILFLTKNKILALLSGLFSSFFVYCYLFKVSFLYFILNLLPVFFFDIISPGGYLYPLLFLLLVAYVINIFKDMEILDSYSNLFNVILKFGDNKIIDYFILLSPIFFFLDDYLIMFGVKSFFSPLIKNTEKNKKELSFYTINIAAGGSVLLFFSTWSGIIINQIKTIQNNIPIWSNVSPISIFLSSKKYFVYPIITYFGLLIYLYNKKNDLFVVNKISNNKKIIWIDIFIFLLLPFSIGFNFFYKLFLISMPLMELDVAYVMLEGLLYGTILIFFFLILYKSVSYKYFINSINQTLLEYKNTVVSLLVCWLFSKISLLSLQANFVFVMPEYLIVLYPVIYFLISLLIAFVLGSEWGALSIMIPLLVCIKDYSNLLLILGAIVSGVIAGAQLSPVSNTSTTVNAIFEVNGLSFYLYRVKYLLFMIFLTIIVYFLLGLFL